jgi:hypothetical protein
MSKESAEINEKYKNYIQIDHSELRLDIPEWTSEVVKTSVYWEIFKDAIGKDLASMYVPVFLCEPLGAM